MSTKQLCPRRAENPGPFNLPESDEWLDDRWEATVEAAEKVKADFEARNPGGSAAMTDWRWPGGIPRTCSYCGGIHPEDAIRLVSEGWEVKMTDKGYKAYLNPPGTATRHQAFLASIRDRTREPGEGVPSVWIPTPPVKLYTQHFDRDQIVRINEAMNKGGG